MENYPYPTKRKSLPLVVGGVLLLGLVGLLVANFGAGGAPPITAPVETGLIEKVGQRLQHALGRTVTIHSDGVVAFPREVTLVVLENHDIQSGTRYESRGWLGIGKSHVVMSGRYRARVGFDLSKASAEVDNGTLRLWLPKPRILAFETLDVGREGEDISWWNPLEPAEMEAAYRANRAEAERRLAEPDLLKGASERLIRRMREGLDGLGLKVRVELLPPPPV